MRELLASDTGIVTWAWSRVEICSAIERRYRHGELTRVSRRQILHEFEKLWQAWDEIVDVRSVANNALRLLARYPIRAADAGQLAAALIACEGQPRGSEIVCLDRNLVLAAEQEGFTTRFWPEDLLD